MKTHRTNRMAKKAEGPRFTFWFVREPADATEAVRIYPLTGSRWHADQELLKPRTRTFRESVDSRGPAVRIMLIYPQVKESVWHPQTEGSYLIVLAGDRPEHLRNISLGFGSVSSPQSTKAAAHRVLLDILAKWPDLRPYLRCAKMPCVFCKDHPDAPGGSSVDVPLESLPPPCEPNQVARFFM